MPITIGADPEVFLINKQGEIVSSVRKIGGTKQNPKKLDDIISVQEDNVLAEFNIKPATSETEFVTYILKGLEGVRSIVTPKSLDIAIVASNIMDTKYLRSNQAKVFGCDPDLNAYTMLFNEAPADPNIQLRSAGGHIHVGGIDPKDAINVVRAMDIYLGIPSVIMDSDTQRKSLYGRAGAFRFKDYGIEYRTLSNFWLKSEALISWAYRNTMRAIENANKSPISHSTVMSIIDNNDKKNAEKIIKTHGLEVINV